MADSAPAPLDIFSLKKSFIESQIRLLNGELRPPRSWQDDVPVGPEGDLSQKVIEPVLSKLNLVARKHNRSVYSAQALRHVAEQIEALYREGMASAERGVEGAMDGGATGADILRRGVDLADVNTIDLLPEDYPNTANASPDDLDRYQTLHARLTHSAISLRTQRHRLEYYKELHAKLTPFRDPQRRVQPNLVTRGGELEKELERMRKAALMLSVQIERAEGLVRKGDEGEGEEDEGEEDEGEEEGDERMEDAEDEEGIAERLARLVDGI